ncbi:MAG TPA: PilZ domain-containing protein [Firmicutes bacterium]|nr:PilZ domain-containing protein [Bacillota bacterium]
MNDREYASEGEILLRNEKREYPRLSMKVKVRYNVLAGEDAEKALTRHYAPEELMDGHREGETVDVSRAGILMNTNEEIRMKSFLNVLMYITVPGISCNVKALAEVVRREMNPETEAYAYKIGLKFHKILHHNLKQYKYAELQDLLNIKEISL